MSAWAPHLDIVARGADAVMYFQRRQSRGGAEKFHSAMVSHAGRTGRTYTETAALGNELAALEPVLDTFTGEAAGRPAVTRHAFGAGVEPVWPGLPAGVEAVRRGQWLFLLNHNEDPLAVSVPGGATDALTGEPLQEEERLAGRGVLVAHLVSPGPVRAAAGT